MKSDERDTIHRIRDAVNRHVVPCEFAPADVNRALGIHWAGVFLPKHWAGNPGGKTELFVGVDRGRYRLK
jgi:hypothetical protein